MRRSFIFIGQRRPPLRPVAEPRRHAAFPLFLFFPIAARKILDPEG